MPGNLTVTFTIDASLTAIQGTNSTLYNTLATAATTADQYYMNNYTASTAITLTNAEYIIFASETNQPWTAPEECG